MDANAGANNNESAATNNNTAASALIADGIAQIQGQLATAAAAAVANQANAQENAPADQPAANGVTNANSKIEAIFSSSEIVYVLLFVFSSKPADERCTPHSGRGQRSPYVR